MYNSCKLRYDTGAVTLVLQVLTRVTVLSRFPRRVSGVNVNGSHCCTPVVASDVLVCSERARESINISIVFPSFPCSHSLFALPHSLLFASLSHSLDQLQTTVRVHENYVLV